MSATVHGRLTVDLGHTTLRGACVRVPSADYHCTRCDTTVSASGDVAAVARFVKTVRASHAAICPANPPD